MVSRKPRCCSSASSWTRFEIAVSVWAGVMPSGPASRSPWAIRRLSRATRTIKNSSILALNMAMNLTRSSKGTLSSKASSSTRRLNSSQDNSRLIKGLSSMQIPPPRGNVFSISLSLESTFPHFYQTFGVRSDNDRYKLSMLNSNPVEQCPNPALHEPIRVHRSEREGRCQSV